MPSPGRPPVGRREHRQRFWEAIARGLSSEEAGVVAGVSPAVGTKWFHENGGMPSSNLAPLSGRYLSLTEREEIAILRGQSFGIREIARRIGRCPSTISRELRRNAATRGGDLHERHAAEREHLLALPDTRFENTKVVGVRISRYQTAQVDSNRYSVPTAYVGRRLWAHIGCDRVSFYADQKEVADHTRAFGHSRWQIDPLHYLDLIRQRVGAFESTRPIRQWRPQWPEHYETLLGRLRDRHGYSRGTREFIGILQLHQHWALDRVSVAVQDALEAHSYESAAVRHILGRAEEPGRRHAPLKSGLMPGMTAQTVSGASTRCSAWRRA